MNWNWIDLLLGLLVLLNVAQGYARGFLLGLFDLLRWVGSVLLAWRFYQPLARFLGEPHGGPGGWDRPVAFLLMLVVASVCLYALEIQLLKRLPPGIHQRRINRALGLAPGFINGLLLAVIVAPLLLAVPLPEKWRTAARDSVLVNRLAVVSDRLEAALAPVIADVQRTLNLYMIPPESTGMLALPFTVATPTARPELEAQMLKLVNQERAAHGLSPLLADPELTVVARQHSTEMFVRGYFSHYTPEGRSPFERMRAANVRFLLAGENLALAPTLRLAHDGLMNSPGHRANLLRPGFGRVGIGIEDGGRYGLMVTQDFRN
jgi:uncharacterized protein YkwD/uncharacterized membrane protein required for colicin V production